MLFLLLLLAPSISQAQSAVATFANGVYGTVTVVANNIFLNINLSNVNESLLPVTDCWANGLKYHVHENWNHNDTLSRFGATECGIDYTGNHFDPFASCSSASANLYCSNNDGCINVSDYSCNVKSYEMNIFSCEIGDWSGKYGVAQINNNMSQMNLSSFWEISPDDLIGKSIVFHCNTADAQRVFCAPFESSNVSFTSNTPVVQSTIVDYVMANFDLNGENSSSIIMYNNGSFQTTFDLRSNTTTTCGQYVYRIYDSWKDPLHTSLNGNACTNVVGNVYDPTNSCFANNSDSEYCHDDRLCNSTSYSYNCDPTNNLYECSPSDLSGRWNGVITNKNNTYFLSGVDSLLIPLHLIIGKSIVIQCENDDTPVACAQITTTVSALKPSETLLMNLINDLRNTLMNLEDRVVNLEKKIVRFAKGFHP